MTARSTYAPDPCGACVVHAIGRCARCSAPLCRAHLPARGVRCAACEAEWDDDERMRRMLQHVFAPPAFLLGGGLAFGLLLPVLMALPFAVGAVIVAAVSTAFGFTAAASACRMIGRTARAQFLREHARALPEMRLLRWPGH